MPADAKGRRAHASAGLRARRARPRPSAEGAAASVERRPGRFRFGMRETMTRASSNGRHCARAHSTPSRPACQILSVELFQGGGRHLPPVRHMSRARETFRERLRPRPGAEKEKGDGRARPSPFSFASRRLRRLKGSTPSRRRRAASRGGACRWRPAGRARPSARARRRPSR